MKSLLEKESSPNMVAVANAAEYAVMIAVTLVTMVGLLRFVGLVG